MYNCDNVDDATSLFQSFFMNIINKHLPLKRIRVRINSSPWITSEYLSMTDRRSYLSKLFDKCPCEFYLNLKKDCIRACQRLKNSLKRDYIEISLERHKGNTKKLWQDIRQFWPSSKNVKTKIKTVNGETDDQMKAESLNTHFCNVGQNIKDATTTNFSINDFMPTYHAPVFEFRIITIENVHEAINRLSNSTASSLDGVTAFMLKAAKPKIATVLCHLFNMSVTTRTFLDIWKPAKVTPLFKQGSSNDPGNYRPISVLPSCGKLMERIIHSQTIDYLESHNLLSESQYGFRANRSTGLCLVDFLHHIYTAIDSGMACGTLYLDLSKAFDCIDHRTLLLKLECLGFRASALGWYGSYLKDRRQVTQVGTALSTEKPVQCGVPQGSILGPMLFLCYIDDLKQHLIYTKPSLFADDTALTVCGKNVAEIGYKLNAELENVTNYFAANGFQLNAKKTKCMLFHSTNRYTTENELLVMSNDTPIEQVPSFKYLGVYVDECLNFKEHVNYVGKKVKQRTSILWRMRSFISRPLAKQLFVSLIAPQFDYCNFVYDGCSKTESRKLEVLQNNALRAVMNVQGPYSATVLHDELQIKWLDVSRKCACVNELYKLLSGQGPLELAGHFKRKLITRNLRSNDDSKLEVPKVRLKMSENDFVYRAVKYWESLTQIQRSAEDIDRFKSVIKSEMPFDHVP